MAQQALFAPLREAQGSGLQGGAEIETRAADGGCEAEEQGREECKADGEGEHPSVDLTTALSLPKGSCSSCEMS